MTSLNSNDRRHESPAVTTYLFASHRHQEAELEAQLAKAKALLSNTGVVSALPDGGASIERRIADLSQQLQTLLSS